VSFIYVKLSNVLVVHRSIPVRSVQELVEYARAHPGTLSSLSGLQDKNQAVLLDDLMRRQTAATSIPAQPD